MPEPHRGESWRDFKRRCIPQVIREGREVGQAYQVCRSLFKRGSGAAEAVVRNPIDVTEPQERDIEAAARDAFDLAREIPLADIKKAIRSGRPVPLFKTAAWKRFLAALRAGILEPIDESAQLGARHMVRTIARERPEIRGALVEGLTSYRMELPDSPIAGPRKPILLDPEIAELGGNWARLHADELVRGVDGRTRQTVRRLVRNASRRLARNPKEEVVDQLARELREQIGLTPKQATRLRRWTFNARRAGWTEARIAEERASRVVRALDQRARILARREVAESFNEGTIRAARLAQKKDRLPLVARKIARTMEDDRVRGRHQLQANMGPVDLDADFPVFQAQRPPWPGEPG